MGIYKVSTVIRVSTDVLADNEEDAVSGTIDLLMEKVEDALSGEGMEVSQFGAPYEYDTAEEVD